MGSQVSLEAPFRAGAPARAHPGFYSTSNPPPIFVDKSHSPLQSPEDKQDLGLHPRGSTWKGECSSPRWDPLHEGLQSSHPALLTELFPPAAGAVRGKTLSPCFSSAQSSCSDPGQAGKGLPEANAWHMQDRGRQGLCRRNRAERHHLCSRDTAAGSRATAYRTRTRAWFTGEVSRAGRSQLGAGSP